MVSRLMRLHTRRMSIPHMFPSEHSVSMLILLQGDATGADDDHIGIDLVGHIPDHKSRFALTLEDIAGQTSLLKATPGLLQQLGHGDGIMHRSLLLLNHG
jgi:hypothetical protein